MKETKVIVQLGGTVQTQPFNNLNFSITIEAELEADDNPDDVYVQLREKARQQIEAHLRPIALAGITRAQGYLGRVGEGLNPKVRDEVDSRLAALFMLTCLNPDGDKLNTESEK